MSERPTQCLDLDGSTRPMVDVLVERRAQYRQRPNAEREEAARVRAGLRGDLNACSCSWPLVIAETETGHEEWCTAHVWQMRETGEPGTVAVRFTRRTP